MDPLMTFFYGLISGLAISVPLGPVGIIVFERSALYGFKTGMISALAVALVDFLFAATFLFGIHAGFTKGTIIPLWATVLGSGIIFLYGLRVYFRHPRKIKKTDPHLGKHFGKMILITLTNPSTYISFGVISVLFNSYLSSSNTEKTLVLLGFLVGALLWWYMLSILAVQKRIHYIESKVHMVLGIIIMLLSVLTILKALL